MLSTRIIINKLMPYLNKLQDFKNVMFVKHLFITNVGISITLSGFGDFLQQNYYINKGEKQYWDVVRTHNMSVSGMTVGILCHHWYNFLDSYMPGKTFKIVIKKVVVDQIFFSPLLISVFFLTVGILEGSTISEIIREAVQKGWRLYAAEWIIWPPAQVINFYLLPTKYRVLYDNTISLGYDIYTSYIKHDIDVDHETKSVILKMTVSRS